jgi:hypothetical protein
MTLLPQRRPDTVRRKGCEYTQNLGLTDSTVDEKRAVFAVVVTSSVRSKARRASLPTSPPPCVDRRRRKPQTTQYRWVDMGYGQPFGDSSQIRLGSDLRDLG